MVYLLRTNVLAKEDAMNSFISWIGGKNYLKKTICARIPPDIDRYVEVFGGAAWVLFYKERYADTEIYNDYNSDLTNLFRCVKYHAPELQRELTWVLNSREVFKNYMEQIHTPGLTDIQNAARFFFLLKVSYGADGRSYGCIKKNVQNMCEFLSRVQTRLASVIIENKDFADLIKVYDRPNTFFYLDPPYHGAEKYYQVAFTEGDHERLYSCLKNIKGRFLLSYNDCEFARERYKDYQIEEVSRQHNLLGRFQKENNIYNELLINNYQ